MKTATNTYEINGKPVGPILFWIVAGIPLGAAHGYRWLTRSWPSWIKVEKRQTRVVK